MRSIIKAKLMTSVIRSFAMISLLLFAALINPTLSQLAPVSPPKGGFKIDGNLRANVIIQGGDWIPRLNTQVFSGGLDSFVLTSAVIPKDATTTGIARDLYNTTADSVFASGSKFNDSIGALHWSTSSAPSKNDINNGLYHVSVNPSNGEQWAFIAGDRASVTGTSYIDFEFLQGTITMNSNGTFTGGGSAGGRTLGDINISMEYTNGGTKPNVIIYKWSGNAATGFFWDSTGSAAYSISNDAFAETNRLGTADVPFGAFGSTTYPQFAFVEAAINISRVISSGTNCQGLKVKTLWIKTKASASTTAALKDFMKPISVSFNFGSVTLTNPGDFCVTATPVTLQATPSGGTFSGRGVVNGNQFDPSVAGPGKDTIYYEVTVGLSCTKRDTAILTVFPQPSASISGATTVCRNATSPFIVIQGSGGIKPYTFGYNIGGGATLFKTTTGTNDTVKIAVPTGTATTITYNLVSVADSACSKTVTGSAAVIINPLPTASAGSSPTSQCYNAGGNTFTLSGSGTNGTALWSILRNPNGLSVAFNSGSQTSFTPSVTLSGGSSGGTVKFLLTVTSNTTPACGTATDSVTVTVISQTSGPTVVYNPPACDETTFSITVSGLQQDDIVTVKDKNGATIAGLSPASPYTVPASTSSKTFTGIPAGSGYQVTLTRNGCVSAPTSCPSSGSRTLRTTTEERSNLITEDVKPAVRAFPNPFNDRVKFVVNSPVAGYGSLEVYNSLGQKVKTIYQGQINLGDQFFELTIPKKQQQTLIYIFRVGNQRVTGKLLQLN